MSKRYENIFSVPYKNVFCRKVNTGSGTTELCREFRCTEDELYEYIRSHAKKGTNGYIHITQTLRNNEQKFAKNGGRKACKRTAAKQSTPNYDNSNKELNDLFAEEKDLTSKVMEAEEQLQEKKSYLCDMVNQIQKMISRKEELLSNDYVKEYIDTYDKCESLDKQIQSCRDEREKIAEYLTKLRMELNSARQKIKELSRTTISVYNTGEIGVMDGPQIALNEDGSIEFQDWLIDQQICQELSIADIKVLARVFAIAKNSEKELEVLFEKEYLEPVYLMLKINNN